VNPAGSKRLVNKGRESRSALTVNGRVSWFRKRWHASGKTGGSVTPLDKLIDAVEATISVGTRELCCRLNGGTMSFDRAAENLEKAAQLRMSGETLRKVVESQGRRVLALKESGELPPGWQGTDCQARTPLGETVTRVYVGADGFTVPLVTQAEKQLRRKKVKHKRQKRGRKCRRLPEAKSGSDEKWKEAKLVTFYDQEMGHRLVSVTRGDCEEAGRIMRRDADGLDFHRADERVGNIDGGPWIIRQTDKHLDLSATGLDFYHLGDNVHKSRRILFGEEDPEGKQWTGELLHTAKHEGYQPLWEGLMEQRKKTRGSKRVEIDRLIHYVSDRREIIRYPEFIASLERWETVTEGPARKGCPLHGALEDRLGADQVGRNMTETLKDLKPMVEP